MMLHAIVYTSNAGSTARYAQLLGQATGLPVFSAQEAHKNRASGDILYLGWVMAGTVKGYQQAAKRYRIHAVYAVGLSQCAPRSNRCGRRPTSPTAFLCSPSRESLSSETAAWGI